MGSKNIMTSRFVFDAASEVKSFKMEDRYVFVQLQRYMQDAENPIRSYIIPSMSVEVNAGNMDVMREFAMKILDAIDHVKELTEDDGQQD